MCRPLDRLCRPLDRRTSLLLAILLGIFVTACHATSRGGIRLKPDPTAGGGGRAGVDALQREIDALINAPELAHGYWGILIKSLKTGDTVYAHDANKLLLPASNMKILTTAVTAARLGWDYTYETNLFGAGSLADGVLDGDLVVVGTGDPQITSATLDAWADRLEATGLRLVTGRLVGDARRFTDEPLGFGWSWTDLADDYSAGVSALQVDEDTIRVTISPARYAGGVAAISTAPPYPHIDMKVTTGAPGSATEIQARRYTGLDPVELSGTIAQGSAPAVLALSAGRPAGFFVSRLRAALIAHGIDVRGPAIAIEENSPIQLRGERRLLLSYRSPALATLATRLMKVSQNLYADTFLKTLGAESQRPTWDGGRGAMRETLESWGVPASDAIVADGSGLSRYNALTAEAIVRVLTHVYEDPKLKEPFLATLPIAGRDGSLENRMKGTAAEGNVRAKTGSMTRVRAVSGYVTTARGEPLVFSILANNFDVAPDVITKRADAIMVRLAELPSATEARR